jgi:hypothetical protein
LGLVTIVLLFERELGEADGWMNSMGWGGAKSRARIACCVTALKPLGLSLEARRCVDAADAAGSRVQGRPRWSRAFGRRELKLTAGMAHADGSIEGAGPRYASARVRLLRRLVLGGMESPDTVEPRLGPIQLMLALRATGYFDACYFCLYPFP